MVNNASVETAVPGIQRDHVTKLALWRFTQR
ncbi:hypothetical protein LEMLEM_LOCUS20909 [Lemmus lemmus]